MFDHSDPYRLLGVARGTPMPEVRAAYRRRLADPRRPTYSPEEQLRFVAALEAIERDRRDAGDPGVPPTAAAKRARRTTLGLSVYAACLLVGGLLALAVSASLHEAGLLATGLLLTAAGAGTALIARFGRGARGQSDHPE